LITIIITINNDVYSIYLHRKSKQRSTFLTTLKAILTLIKDDVSPSITYNTYASLLDNLQLLYVCHVKVVVVLIVITLLLIKNLKCLKKIDNYFF